jgi:hypothetical protein
VAAGSASRNSLMVSNCTSACCTSRLARGNAQEQTHSETSSNYLCTNDGLETGGLPSGGCGHSNTEREFPSDKVYRRDDRRIIGAESSPTDVFTFDATGSETGVTTIDDLPFYETSTGTEDFDVIDTTLTGDPTVGTFDARVTDTDILGVTNVEDVVTSDLTGATGDPTVGSIYDTTTFDSSGFENIFTEIPSATAGGAPPSQISSTRLSVTTPFRRRWIQFSPIFWALSALTALLLLLVLLLTPRGLLRSMASLASWASSSPAS